jgi:hypothetical protein
MSANLRTRLKDIEQMKENCAIRKTYRSMDKDVVEEPVYNIKQLDQKSVEIHNALFQIDRSIKETNAKVEIELSVEYSKLMEAVQ